MGARYIKRDFDQKVTGVEKKKHPKTEILFRKIREKYSRALYPIDFQSRKAPDRHPGRSGIFAFFLRKVENNG